MTRLCLTLIAALTVALAWQTVALERLKADVAEKAAAQAEADLIKTRAAAATVARLRDQLDAAKEAERALPNGAACGLDAGRVRLLPRPK